MMTDDTDPTSNTRLLVDAAIASMTILFTSEDKRLFDALETHIKYTRQLSQAETERINELRRVDTAAVLLANERAATQALVLANQVQTSAETLRALVATTAGAQSAQQVQVTTQVLERLTAVEKGQYESAGRSGTASSLLDRVSNLEGGNRNQKPGATSTSTPLLIALLVVLGICIVVIIFLALRTMK
jgi:hypothetical protein